MNNKQVTYKRTPTHYKIYVDGEFYSTCDFNELEDEMDEIKLNEKEI